MILPAYNNGFLAVIGYNLILFLISAHYLYELFIVNHIQSGLVPEKNIHWSVKQIDGTVDWAPGSHFGNWVSGGLSHQVIHHVFPNITHWIYPYLVPTFR
jgi:fatty acid desaturase